MNRYEALFIIDPDKEKSLQGVIGNITAGITKNNGKIDKEETWGKQRLAFPIKKNTEGLYYKLNFSVQPTKISALNNAYKLNADILRVIITKR